MLQNLNQRQGTPLPRPQWPPQVLWEMGLDLRDHAAFKFPCSNSTHQLIPASSQHTCLKWCSTLPTDHTDAFSPGSARGTSNAESQLALSQDKGSSSLLLGKVVIHTNPGSPRPAMASCPNCCFCPGLNNSSSGWNVNAKSFHFPSITEPKPAIRKQMVSLAPNIQVTTISWPHPQHSFPLISFIFL